MHENSYQLKNLVFLRVNATHNSAIIYSKTLNNQFSILFSWFPFLDSVESAVAVLQRLFPFARGLYEVGARLCFLL